MTTVASIEDSKREALTPDERREKARLVRRRLRQFTDPFEVREPWWSWDAHGGKWYDVPMGDHVTELPPLLEQIDMAVSRVGWSSGTTGSFESRPAAVLDAIDARERIRVSAAEKVRELTGGEPSVLPESNLTSLGALASTLSDDELRALERDVRSWWAHAKIVAGMDDRPMAPHVRCPRCDTLDSLRVRLDIPGRFGLAMCRECLAVWTGDPVAAAENEDAGYIGILLRAIKEQEAEAASASVPVEVRHTLEWSFRSHHDAAAVDPKGEVKVCESCSAQASAAASSVRGRAVDVVERHPAGTAHFCSLCKAFHPGRA
ncbi:hypothetical protein LGT39_05820 [Demequina sp. TTPB684]|uniref:hypothetical protein n=1 Tax=unclassified Demequina TaxID=2620311 RepID=UPI001CF47D9F|nr:MULTISPECIES: hypothetical protein [unclassified Demequina]MCB2412365.1 hypothetical protein [Demequina sp. TTPB684]UPU89035.1 hypothetical protein LGT36_003675 [Demequina sp. TMPB413]